MAVAFFILELYLCTPPYLLGIDEIFPKRYGMTLKLERLQSYQRSKLNVCLERVFGRNLHSKSCVYLHRADFEG